MSPRVLRRVGVLLSALGVLLLSSSSIASAADGTFSSYACQGPTGAPVAAAGWEPFRSPGATTTDACASGGPFGAQIGPNNPAFGTRAGWKFTAPAGLSIARLTATRSTFGFTGGNPNSLLDYRVGQDGPSIDACTQTGTDCANDKTGVLDQPGLTTSSLTFVASCTNSSTGECPTIAGGAGFNVNQAVVRLKDDAKPTVANPAVVDDGDSSGTLKVRFDAADQGGGLYRLNTLVDGKPFAVEPLGTGACTDANPADADPHQFVSPQPCPLSISGREVGVNYKQLTPGPHLVQTEVEDAAGNTTTVSAAPFPKANGDGSAADYERLRTAKFRAWFVKGKQHPRRLSINVGARSSIRGDVVDKKGKGIAGVRLDVYHVLSNGKKTLAKTGLKTRTNGRFTYIVSSRVDTRKIQMTYRIVRPGPVSNRRTLALTVKKKGKTFYLPGNKPKASKKR